MRARPHLLVAAAVAVVAHALVPAPQAQAVVAPVTVVTPPKPFVNTSRATVVNSYRGTYRPAAAVPISYVGGATPSLCQPGTLTSTYLGAQMKQLNSLRALYGMPPVTWFSSADNAKAQWAATVMAASGRIAHAIDATWTCYSSAQTPNGNLAAMGAATSSLTQFYAGSPWVLNFAVESGSGQIGHRMEMMDPSTTTIAVGAKNGPAGQPGAGVLTRVDLNRDYTRAPSGSHAWPPAGWFPVQHLGYRAPWMWSSGLTGLDTSAVSVTMRRGDGTPVTVTNVGNGGFNPDQVVWEAEGVQVVSGSAYTTYIVTISGIKQNGVLVAPVTYSVILFDAMYGNPDGTTPTAIAGSPWFGSMLEARPGTWQPLATSYRYQWYRISGSRVMAINGATGRYYRPTLTDSGWNLTVAVTGSSNGVADRRSVAARTAVVTARPA